MTHFVSSGFMTISERYPAAIPGEEEAFPLYHTSGVFTDRKNVQLKSSARIPIFSTKKKSKKSSKLTKYKEKGMQ